MIGKDEFVAAIDEKSTMLYRVARTILRRDEDCKDALQESVLKAWQSRHKLSDPQLFSTWITRILINECYTILRKTKRLILLDDVSAENIASQSPHVPDRQLQLALEALPEKLRLPLVLHYVEGYTYEEMSKILRLPQSTIRGRLSRGREALKLEIIDDERAWQHAAK